MLSTISSKYLWAAAATVLAVACAIPLKKLNALPPRHAAIDATLMQVQSMAAQAKLIKSENSAAPPPLTRAQVEQAFGPNAIVRAGEGGAIVAQLQELQAAQFFAGLEMLAREANAAVNTSTLATANGKISGQIQFLAPR